MSFQSNIKKAAIATSCEPQFEISSEGGRMSFGFEYTKAEGEGEEEEGKLYSKIFYRWQRTDMRTYLINVPLHIFNLSTPSFRSSRIKMSMTIF